MATRISKPLCANKVGKNYIDKGTRCLSPSPKPGIIGKGDNHQNTSTDIKKKILSYLRSFQVPTHIQIGHLWNQYKVISLGETHDERKHNAKFIGQVITSYGQSGDIVAIEADRQEQQSVDDFLAGGPKPTGPEAKEFMGVLTACRERNGKVIFVAGSEFSDDKKMFQSLVSKTGNLSGKRLLLFSGKAHALWEHASGLKPGFVRMVVDEVGRKNVVTVSLHRAGPGEKMVFHSTSEKVFTLSLESVGRKLVPTRKANSPFHSIKWAYYQVVVSSATDYIGFT